MNVEFIDNSEQVKSAMHDALIRALEKIGMTAEKYAKRLCPVDTGNLRNSITHRVNEEEPAAYVGSDTEYAAYVESEPVSIIRAEDLRRGRIRTQMGIGTGRREIKHSRI